MNQSTANQTSVDLIGWIRDNWVWAAPLIYIYVTIVGMVQAWLQFNAFDINVFEFSEMNDFLLAAFREPLSLLAILTLIAYGGIGLLVQSIVFGDFLRKGKSKSPERMVRMRMTYKLIMYVFLVIIVFLAPYYGSKILHQGYGEKWKERFVSEPTRQVEALIKDLEKKDGTEKGWVKNLTLIGTTDKFVFFHDRIKKRTLIAPLNNVLLIKQIETTDTPNPAKAHIPRG